jgi:hypothetical protein
LPPWQASAASRGADSTIIADPTQTERGRVVGGGYIEAIYLNRLIDSVLIKLLATLLFIKNKLRHN